MLPALLLRVCSLIPEDSQQVFCVSRISEEGVQLSTRLTARQMHELALEYVQWICYHGYKNLV